MYKCSCIVCMFWFFRFSIPFKWITDKIMIIFFFLGTKIMIILDLWFTFECNFWILLITLQSWNSVLCILFCFDFSLGLFVNFWFINGFFLWQFCFCMQFFVIVAWVFLLYSTLLCDCLLNFIQMAKSQDKIPIHKEILSVIDSLKKQVVADNFVSIKVCFLCLALIEVVCFLDMTFVYVN